jgi:hypothetical protein
MPGSTTRNLEREAWSVRHYVQGLAEGLQAASPIVIQALSSEITSKLCEGPLPDEQSLTLAYLLQQVPEATSSEGLECFFANNQAREGLPFWEMLSAWRGSGVEKGPALAQIEATAADERTQMRLASVDSIRQRIEEHAEGDPNAGSVATAMTSAERQAFIVGRSEGSLPAPDQARSLAQ